MNINNIINELSSQRIKKDLFRRILFIVYPAYFVHSCITSPIFTIFDSNVETVELALLFYALNIVIDLFVMFFSYSVIIYGIYRLSLKDIKPAFCLALLAPVFKYVLKLIVSPIIDGFVSFDQFIMDIYTIAVSGTLEMLQFLAVVLIARKYINRHKSIVEVVNKASERVGSKNPLDLQVFPFKSFFDFKNPIQRGAVASAVIVTGLRVLMLLISDISKGIVLSDFMNIVLFFGGYILELGVGFIGYMFMLYVFIHLEQKNDPS